MESLNLGSFLYEAMQVKIAEESVEVTLKLAERSKSFIENWRHHEDKNSYTRNVERKFCVITWYDFHSS